MLSRWRNTNNICCYNLRQYKYCYYSNIINYDEIQKLLCINLEYQKKANKFNNELIEHQAINISNIRNFCIIAHVDHGKSTLADAMMSCIGQKNTITTEAPSLDTLEVEQQRGITVKANTASMFYHYNNQTYLLNLIDTPGHVDFSFEVNRSLQACQGALLLIDIAQGIQAQTLAHYWTAIDFGLDIIPVLTKIDLPHYDEELMLESIENTLAIDREEVLKCSSKSLEGVLDLFPVLIERLSPPKPLSWSLENINNDNTSNITNNTINNNNNNNNMNHEKKNKMIDPRHQFRALLFDSWYDNHRGVICLIYVANGCVRAHDSVSMYHSRKSYDVQEVGILMNNNRENTGLLRTGQVGYIICGIGSKNTRDILVGDTFYNSAIKEFAEPLPGFKLSKPMVFAGIYPSDESDYEALTKAIDKLSINDTSVVIQPDQSDALGSGFRCGFLGILHMDVFTQRLDQEFNASVIVTSPTVPYQIAFKANVREKYEQIYSNSSYLDESSHLKLYDTNEEDSQEILEHSITVRSASEWPQSGKQDILKAFEPVSKVTIISPVTYLGTLLKLCQDNRGELISTEYVDQNTVVIKQIIPLSAVITQMYEKIQSASSGYASFDYEPVGFRSADLVKVEVRLNGDAIEPLAFICDRHSAMLRGREVVRKLKEVMNRQNFEVIIQCALDNKIIARERLAAYRKDVLIKSGKVVGGGAFGKVYMAMNNKTAEIIAVKQVVFNENEVDTMKQLQMEINLMKTLAHENIVRFYEVQKEGKKLNILMEYVPGSSLDAILSKFGALDEKVIRNYTRQLCTALKYVHSKNITHRDIKGKNVLVDTSGVLKLADFGSAKELFEAKVQPSINYSYTPLWTAPEVLQGNYDTKIDVWSMGCVIIEMATADQPWAEQKFENPFRALYHIGNSNKIPKFPTNLSDTGTDFLSKCLCRDPTKRWTAAQLLKHPWLQPEQGFNNNNSSDDDDDDDDDDVGNLKFNITVS